MEKIVKYIKEICEESQDVMDKVDDLDECIQLFLDTLEYKIDFKELQAVEDIRSYLIKLVEEKLDESDYMLLHHSLNTTEVYARKVLYLTNKKRLNEIIAEGRGYSPVLKSLGFTSREVGEMADRRNKVHQAEKLSRRKILEHIDQFIIDYILITNNRKDELKAVIYSKTLDNNKTATFVDYCNAICSVYKKKEKEGFKYVELRWVNADNAKESSIDKAFEDSKTNAIKVLAEAGSGKTTLLKRIEYDYASRYINNNNGLIPVFLGLGQCEYSSDSIDIITQASERLSVEKSVVTDLLQNGKIVFLLDGFNEIVKFDIRKGFAWAVETIHEKYPKVKIILSDRTIMKKAIGVLNYSEKYILQKLSLEEKRELIEGNCSDEYARNMIINQFNKNPSYFNSISLPIHIYHLIIVVTKKQLLPVDLTEEFIEYLLDREIIDQKNSNGEYVKIFAASLALEIDKKGKITELTAERCLAVCKVKMGYTIPDTRLCLNLMIELNILVRNEEYIEFSSEEYKDYFWAYALLNNLEEVLYND